LVDEGGQVGRSARGRGRGLDPDLADRCGGRRGQLPLAETPLRREHLLVGREHDRLEFFKLHRLRQEMGREDQLAALRAKFRLELLRGMTRDHQHRERSRRLGLQGGEDLDPVHSGHAVIEGQHFDRRLRPHEVEGLLSVPRHKDFFKTDILAEKGLQSELEGGILVDDENGRHVGERRGVEGAVFVGQAKAHGR
jgi:hypothetical protein